MPDGRKFTAPYFGVALARFYPQLTCMKVFVTERAQEEHLQRFQDLVEDHAAVLESVRIPDGTDEDELWSLFQTVVDAVDEKEEVVFDITHGFRSLPFLSLLAVAYLREVKDINLNAILYGNFEARDRSVEPHETPVIDLSGLVSLFDWMTAANRFTRFGDATDLAQLLRKARPPKQRERPDAASREQSKRLSLAARSLSSVSLALRLIRPEEAMHASSELPGRLLDVAQSLQSNARPFVPLVHSITDKYAPLEMSREQQEEDVAGRLECERSMINWLLERQQYVQAVTIAREWVVSWVMVQVEMEDIIAVAPVPA